MRGCASPYLSGLPNALLTKTPYPLLVFSNRKFLIRTGVFIPDAEVYFSKKTSKIAVRFSLLLPMQKNEVSRRYLPDGIEEISAANFLCFALLICQPFASVIGIDDTAVMKTVFFKHMLHYVVIAVGVDF